MASRAKNWGLGPDARKRLGRNLAVRRLRQGMSRKDLATRAGVTVTRVSSLENGVSAAGIDVWVRIAGALDDGSTVDDLLAGVRWVVSEGARTEGGEYVVQRQPAS